MSGFALGHAACFVGAATGQPKRRALCNLFYVHEYAIGNINIPEMCVASCKAFDSRSVTGLDRSRLKRSRAWDSGAIRLAISTS